MNRALWEVSGLWKGIALLDCFRLLLSSREWQERPRRSHSSHDLIDGTFLRRCACWANWVPVVQSDPEVVPPLTYSLAKSSFCKICKPHPSGDLHQLWTLYMSVWFLYDYNGCIINMIQILQHQLKKHFSSSRVQLLKELKKVGAPSYDP